MSLAELRGIAEWRGDPARPSGDSGSVFGQPPGVELSAPLSLRLWRDRRPRPTSAAFCSLSLLGEWVEQALSCEISAIQGAIQGDSVLLLGKKLPRWPGSTRYWGGQLLVPIGFEIRPSLPESTILEAIGNPGRELLRVISDREDYDLAVEPIPLDTFRPLTRAGVRLALAGAPTP